MPRLYGRRWAKARKQFLVENPCCVYCHAEGRLLVPATVVDHIKPHRGNPVLFWAPDNWQALCETHHNAAKQAQEKSGVIRGCDSSGAPLDPAHHWNT